MSPLTSPASGSGVATSHYLASEAGARALQAGGNAVDAAIAAAAALCVVYPNNVALGGDLVALVRDPAGRITFVNATGRAPSGASLDAFRARHGNALPDRGVDTITIPGGVRGWKALASLGGRLDWHERLADAQRFARDGVPVARSVAHAIHLERDALLADPGCRALFYPEGAALQVGDLLRQPALADTLQGLIDGGPDAFYAGPIADRWIAGLQSVGSTISPGDVATYSPTLEEPLSASAHGLDIVTSPPNTQGFSLLRTVRALADDAAIAQNAGALAGIFRESNRVRARWLTDPDIAPVPAESLISIPTAEAGGDPRAATGDTVGLVAVSDDGWAVSLVQSVYWAFGACILEPTTGVLFQNRGTSFSLDPEHPAALAPGRRPPHTLMPVLVLRDGDLAYAAATMGGQAQPQIHAHLLLAVLAGASAVEATSAPRWVVGAQDDDDTEATLTVEADVAPAVRDSLRTAGLTVKTVPPRDERLGHSNLILVTASGLDAASDPRSDGSAILLEPTAQNERETR